MVELRILGRLQVVVDGHVVDVGPPAQQRLVLRLGLAAATGLTVDRLLDDLRVSAVALRTAVSRLRKSLGPAVITVDSGYRLQSVELDADRF
jgi:DNA-binding SARP family transcriptional activator